MRGIDIEMSSSYVFLLLQQILYILTKLFGKVGNSYSLALSLKKTNNMLMV